MNNAIETRGEQRSVTQTVDQSLDRLSQALHQNVVFGAPIERGETIVIPCAEVAIGMGLGGGTGTSPNKDQTTKSTGEGAGGGGGGRARPVAAIIITGGKVRIEPIIDATRIALAGIALSTFTVFTLWRGYRLTQKAMVARARLKKA